MFAVFRTAKLNQLGAANTPAIVDNRPSMEPTDDSGGRIKADGLSFVTVAVYMAGIMAGVGMLALPRALSDAGQCCA